MGNQVAAVTPIIVVDHYDPDEGDSTIPIYLDYVFPSAPTAKLVKATLSWRRRAFRSTVSISATGMTTDASGSSGHAHTIPIAAGPFTNAIGHSAAGGGMQSGFGPTTAGSVNGESGHSHSHTHTLTGGSGSQTLLEGTTSNVNSVTIDGRDVTATLGGPWTGDVVEMDITSVFRVEPGFWHTIAILLAGQGRLLSLLRLSYTV